MEQVDLVRNLQAALHQVTRLTFIIMANITIIIYQLQYSNLSLSGASETAVNAAFVAQGK